MFINIIIYDSQKVELTQIFINGWIDKQNVLFPYNDILFILNKEILAHTTMWMNVEAIMLNKISQSQQDKEYMIPLIWGTWSSQIHRDRE